MIRYLLGDAREQLATLPADSVHCVVTSPPYWGLRAYGGESRMIGLEQTFDEHVANLVAVFREIRRVLHPQGIAWLNYGDAYAGSWGNYSPTGTGGQRPKHIERWSRPAYTDTKRLPPASDPKRSIGLKPKDLMFLPFRVALALQTDGMPDHAALHVLGSLYERICEAYGGNALVPDRVDAVLSEMCEHYAAASDDAWWVRSRVVWEKENPMPESVEDRPVCAYEEVFMLTKGRHYWYDRIAVLRPPSPESIARAQRARHTGYHPDGQHPHHGIAATRPNRGRSTYGRHTLGKAIPERERRRGHKRTHKGFRDRWDKMSRAEQSAAGANMRNVLTLATRGMGSFCPECFAKVRIKGDHFTCHDCHQRFHKDDALSHHATFPPALVEPFVKNTTSEKGCCPECGNQWQRIIETPKVPDELRNRTGVKMEYNPPKTIGWEPTCECEGVTEADLKPPVVLDPFCGTGTTGLVANRLGRDGILIDINPAYIGITKRRIREDAPLFNLG